MPSAIITLPSSIDLHSLHIYEREKKEGMDIHEENSSSWKITMSPLCHAIPEFDRKQNVLLSMFSTVVVVMRERMEKKKCLPNSSPPPPSLSSRKEE
jgi:hypothetical protein